MEGKGSLNKFLFLVISIGLVALLLATPSATSAQIGNTSRVPHDPIFIENNDSFTSANGVTSGSGTQADPYIIENWVIDASSAHGIYIRNTTAYFIVRNCLVENGNKYYDTHTGIYLSNVANGRLEKNTCGNNGDGIRLEYSYNNVVINNTCSNGNDCGICLYHSPCSILDNNLCENNFSVGISLGYSDNSVLTNNNCSNNTNDGISVYGSSYSTLAGNTCRSNEHGIILVYSSNNNTIHHNYLLNNTENNAYDDGTNNWDNGSEGNWWSDWQPPEHPDADGNGIVDEPRPIEGGSSVDRYPLVMAAPNVIKAKIDIKPDKLNLKDPGRWVWASIELPPGYGVKHVKGEPYRLDVKVKGCLTQGQQETLDALVREIEATLATVEIKIDTNWPHWNCSKWPPVNKVWVRVEGYLSERGRALLEELVQELRQEGNKVEVRIEKKINWRNYRSTIDIGSVRLENVPATGRLKGKFIPELWDRDRDGLPELVVKFDRAAVQALLQPGEVELKVTGRLTDGTPFEGSDTIKVVEHRR
jgi:parallel beta-helix repeat protein